MAIKNLCLPVLCRKVHQAGRGLGGPGLPFPGPAPSGSHLQSRSLASSVHCRHSGGPGSPLGSDS